MAGEGEVAGYARLGLRSADRRAWWWTAVVGRGRTLVMVRDHEVDPPRGGSLEIRASGLWAEPVCETPLDHWSLGLEAAAVALEDPTDAYRGEWGEPVPLGLDLEWEASGPAVTVDTVGSRYRQASAVHGEVLVGRERLAVAGRGVREHAWGEREWWAEAAPWAAGTLDDGTAVGSAPGVNVAVDLDGRGLIAGGSLRAGEGGEEARLHPVLHAPLQLPSSDGRASRLARALCRVETSGGRGGWAWAERLQPA